MQEIRTNRIELTSAHVLVAGFVVTCAVAAFLIGAFPLQMSIATIFLFAAIHNFMEFRYFAARMPLRWGRSKTYYTVGIAGVLVLAAGYLTLFVVNGNWLWSTEVSGAMTATWNSALVIWLAALVYLRGKQRPKGDWTWAFPAAFILAALAWLIPSYWSLSLVYIHPFIAMWFLERQIRRTKPEWLRAYHYCLASIPVFVLVLWFSLSNTTNLPADTALFWRITQHAGSEILTGVSSRFLVATHVFLESIHYFVWILLMPLVDWRAVPWKLSGIPLFAGKGGYPTIVVSALAVSIGLVVVYWVGFSVDYATTRDVYFAFAIAHVMAEFPFLIKML